MKTLKTILQEVISGIKAWVDANTVHKSGDETIDGTKTFSAPQCYSSNAILFNSSVLPTQNTAPSGTINPLRQYVGYGTSYANSVFIHDTEMRANGRNHYRWTIYSDDHSANAAMWLVYNPDSEYLRYLDLKGSFVPDSDGTYHLGIPTQRWKTINGINPGALSLPGAYQSINDQIKNPSDQLNAVDLNGGSNTWVSDVDCYLYFYIPNNKFTWIRIFWPPTLVRCGQTFVPVPNETSDYSGFVPVPANTTVVIQIKGTQAPVFRRSACLGNV